MKTPHSPEHICSGHAAIYDYGFLLLFFRGRLGQKLVQVELILRVTEVADHRKSGCKYFKKLATFCAGAL